MSKSKRSHKRGIVIPDVHFPLEEQPAINCVLQAIKIVKPDVFICLGDLGEWRSASPYRYKRQKRPPLEYQLPEIEKEAELVNEGLDQFDKVLDQVKCHERHMIEGNHDDWLNSFVEEYPYLSQFKFRNVMGLDERGYKYHRYGKYLKIGKLYFYHGGHYSTISHTRQHAMNLGKNVVYGHTHDVQRSGVTHVDGPHHAFSMGCLKDMRAESNVWLKGRHTNWAHAFGIIDWDRLGNFTLNVVDIHKGKTFVWGQEINGNE